MKRMDIIKMLVAFTLISVAAGVMAQKYETVKPLEYYKKATILKGKPVSYYYLSHKQPVSVKVAGVKQLAVFTRVLPKKESSGNYNPYTIKYSFDEESSIYSKEIKKVSKSKKALPIDKSLEGTPSTYSKFIVDIPEGVSTINFYKTKRGQNIGIHFSVDKGDKYNPKWVNKEPEPAPDDYEIILVGNKKVYYTLSRKNKTSVTVNGPGTLVVSSVIRIADGEDISKSYNIHYVIDGKLNKIKEFRSSPKSENLLYYYRNVMHKFPSKARKFSIKLTPGEHIVDFFTDSDEKIDIRFSFKKNTKPIWVEFTETVDSTVSLRVIGKNTIRKYVRLNNEKPLIVDVEGPTVMRLYVRAEFEYYMHSDNNFRIEAKDGDDIIKTYRLSSRRSTKVEYEKNKDLIPGTLNKIFIEVPDGKHTYYLTMKDKNKSTLIRLFYNKNNTPLIN